MTAAETTGENQDDIIEVVPTRHPEALGFFFKVRASGRVYRFEPTRDTRQPRYWCFRIYRCTSGGMADMTERPWLGSGDMTREDLPAAVSAIRENPNGWLATEALQSLRDWLLTPGSAPSVDELLIGNHSLRRNVVAKSETARPAPK